MPIPKYIGRKRELKEGDIRTIKGVKYRLNKNSRWERESALKRKGKISYLAANVSGFAAMAGIGYTVIKSFKRQPGRALVGLGVTAASTIASSVFSRKYSSTEADRLDFEIKKLDKLHSSRRIGLKAGGAAFATASGLAAGGLLLMKKVGMRRSILGSIVFGVASSLAGQAVGMGIVRRYGEKVYKKYERKGVNNQLRKDIKLRKRQLYTRTASDVAIGASLGEFIGWGYSGGTFKMLRPHIVKGFKSKGVRKAVRPFISIYNKVDTKWAGTGRVKSSKYRTILKKQIARHKLAKTPKSHPEFVQAREMLKKATKKSRVSTPRRIYHFITGKPWITIIKQSTKASVRKKKTYRKHTGKVFRLTYNK